MSKVCQITGKKDVSGNHVSHSNRKTKRRFHVNFFRKKFFCREKNCWVNLRVSVNGVRIIDKIGLDAAVLRAIEKGVFNCKKRT